MAWFCTENGLRGGQRLRMERPWCKSEDYVLVHAAVAENGARWISASVCGTPGGFSSPSGTVDSVGLCGSSKCIPESSGGAAVENFEEVHVAEGGSWYFSGLGCFFVASRPKWH